MLLQKQLLWMQNAMTSWFQYSQGRRKEIKEERRSPKEDENKKKSNQAYNNSARSFDSLSYLSFYSWKK